MTTIRADLTVRSMESGDEADVVRLLTSSLGEGPTGRRTTEFFRWKHRASPFGSSPGLVAVDNDRLVGVRLFMPWRLHALGSPLHAVRAVDTATHPNFRGHGIFRRLTLDLLRTLDEAGEVDLVFNTPNGSSKPGYLKMGWREVGQLPVHIGVHRPLRFLRGMRSATAATAASSGSFPGRPTDTRRTIAESPFPPVDKVLAENGQQVCDLLSEIAPPPGFHTPRGLDFLQWRYADPPGLDYRAITIESSSGLRGLAFGRLRQRGALTELTVGDVLARDGDHEVVKRILSDARASGADHVTVHLNSPSDIRAARSAGFVKVPRYGVGLVVNPRRDLPVDPHALSSWNLALGDLEVF